MKTIAKSDEREWEIDEKEHVWLAIGGTSSHGVCRWLNQSGRYQRALERIFPLWKGDCFAPSEEGRKGLWLRFCDVHALSRVAEGAPVKWWVVGEWKTGASGGGEPAGNHSNGGLVTDEESELEDGQL